MKIGDSVKIKENVFDEDINIPISGWQGRILNIVSEFEDGSSLVHIEFDSFTLKKMPAKYIINCEREGYDWTSYNIGSLEIEPASERDTPNDVKETLQQLQDKYAYAHLEEGERIMKVLNGLSPDDYEAAYKRWFDYLNDTLKLPEKMEIFEYQENSEFHINDKIFVKQLKEINPHYGIIINGVWNLQPVDFQLSDLEVIDKKSKNYQPVMDYCVWFGNR